MRTKTVLTLVSVGAAMLLTSCHKRCTCLGRDGSERTYTAAEVDERGGSCSNLEVLGNESFYIYCSWE